jgi:hypothetical protein
LREYLTEAEVERLMDAAKANRLGHRDSTVILSCRKFQTRTNQWCNPLKIGWAKKGLAGSRGRPPSRRHVLCDRGLPDINAEHMRGPYCNEFYQSRKTVAKLQPILATSVVASMRLIGRTN